MNNIVPYEPQQDASMKQTNITDKTETTEKKSTRKDYFASWREANREKIRENWSSKNVDIECECGLKIKKYNKINHQKTKRHKSLMEEKNN